MSVSKETWGNNVWYLLHGISHKINSEKFTENKNDIINLILLICNNLPCPECSKDASDKLKQINFDNINTKEDLIKLIFNFHNWVNKKLNKNLFDFDDLNNKYDKINLHIVSNNINIIFKSNSNIPQLMSHSMRRQLTLPKISNLINKILPNCN